MALCVALTCKHALQGCILQGMLGETYDRFIAGDAASQKSSPLYLPDDGQFHGVGKRAQYKMDSYWDTNHVSMSENASETFSAVLSPASGIVGLCNCLGLSLNPEDASERV